MKALFTFDFGKEKMDLFQNMGYDIVYEHEKHVSANELTEDAEILVCYNPFNTLDITRLKKLKWMQLTSIGIDQVPLSYIKEKGIILTNNKGGYSIPMGEWIILKILEMIKKSKVLYERQRERKWHMDTSLLELYGKTVGFIGTGSIAKEAAKRLQGFGVKILGLNTTGRLVQYFDECYPMEALDRMVGECDVVVLTIPYTNKTHHLMDGSRLEKMKEGSYLINVSRGSIVDEKALIDSLRGNKLRAAALDVFEKEPLDKDSPLWDLDNVIITSHNSWISEMRNERRFQIIYSNMKRYAQGDELQNMVDLLKGY